MIKINPKIIIISIVSLLIIMTILILIYVNSNDDNAQQETSISDTTSTESRSSSTKTISQQDTTSEIISEEEANIELPANYTEDMQPIDYAMGKLPIKNDDYFIYSTDGISFFVDINAYENTERGDELKQSVNKWFTDQGLVIDDIGILYIYRSES